MMKNCDLQFLSIKFIWTFLLGKNDSLLNLNIPQSAQFASIFTASGWCAVLVAGAGVALAAGKCENGQKSGFSVDVNNFLRLLDRKVKDKGPT